MNSTRNEELRMPDQRDPKAALLYAATVVLSLIVVLMDVFVWRP